MKNFCFIFLLLILVVSNTFAQNDSELPVNTPTPLPPMESHAIAAVISGDLLKMDTGQIVKLAGISCYEPFDFGWVDQMNPNRRVFADRAMARTSGLVTERNIFLNLTDESPDTLGRLCGYIYLPDRRCLNEILLIEGLATIPSGVNTHPREAEYQNLQNEAKSEKAGVWEIDPGSISIARFGGSRGNDGNSSHIKGVISLLSYLGILAVIIGIIFYVIKILQSGTKDCPMCQIQVPKRDPRCQNCGYNFETGYLGSAELQNWVSTNIKVVKKRNKKIRR